MKSRLLAAALVAVLVAPLAAPPLSAQAGTELQARVFSVRYRDLADAAEIVGAVLSADGTLTLRPRQKALVVQDRPAVLERVTTLLRDWDLPPRAVEVTISLFLGKREGGPATPGAPRAEELSREVRGVLESLRDFTRWTSYEPLGSRSVTGLEGTPVVVQVTGDYRVAFTLGGVDERPGGTRVRFERLSLQREVAAGDGGRRVEDLYTAGIVVEADRLMVVGAASDSNSQRALFLAVQARPR